MPRTRLFLLLALLLAGCAGGPHLSPPPAAPKRAKVYVIGRGWHTDIALAATDLAGPLSRLEARYPGATYLVFGFGERGYVVDHRTDILHMARALLPARGAILVTALSASPKAAFGAPHVVALPASAAQTEAVSRFLWSAFQRDAQGAPERIGDGPYQGSEFYASAVTYDAFYTCNTWTAAALRQAGYPIVASGILFAAQVMRQARRLGDAPH